MMRSKRKGSAIVPLMAALVLVAGAMAGLSAMLRQTLGGSVAFQLGAERDDMLKVLAVQARNPDNLARTASLVSAFKACYDWNNTNTVAGCVTNFPQPDGSFSPAPTKIDFYDSMGNRIAGTPAPTRAGRILPGMIIGSPVRYNRFGGICPTGAAASADCLYEVYATFTAVCPPVPPSVTPAATCVRTNNVQVQLVVQQSSARAPAQMFPIQSRTTNQMQSGWTPAGASCPQGTTMTGIDKAGNPICVVKTAGACPAGTFLYAYDPSTTVNNTQCRSLASVCPAGYHWQGLNRNFANALLDTNGNAPGFCQVDNVTGCGAIGKPLGFVTQVNFNDQTVNCSVPLFSSCGADTVQQGNNADGSPRCIPWASALPTVNSDLYNINLDVSRVNTAFTNMRQDACARNGNKAIRNIGAFTDNWGAWNDGYPLCLHPPSDFNGDDIPDIVVGAGDGGGPRVEVLSGGPSGPDEYNPLQNWFAYDPALRDGIVVGMADVNGDGLADVLTMPNAPGGGPALGIWPGPNRGGSWLEFVIDTSGNLRTGYSVGP